VRGYTERQIKRRENILAAARKLISEKGYDGVNMRDLARESGVAPKTLYHQFENREKLLRTAVEERFRYIYQMIDEVQIDNGVDRVFHIIDRIAEITTDNAAYARALVPLFGADQDRRFAAICMQTYRRALDQLAADRSLAEWVDIDVLALTLFRQMNAIYMAGAASLKATDAAICEVKLDICLILASACRGRARERFLSTAEALQAQLKPAMPS